MIQRFLLWVRGRFRVTPEQLATQTIYKLKCENNRSDKLIRQLASLQRQFNRTVKKEQRKFNRKVGDALDLEDGRKQINAQYEETIEAFKSKDKVQSEIMIPALISAHKMHIERTKAETAIEVRRQVDHSSPEVL